MKVLISGASGDIGVGCSKILSRVDYVTTIFGCDINRKPWNKYYLDRFIPSPSAKAPEYVDWLFHIIEKNEIEIFVPTSEAELERLSQEKVPSNLTKRIAMVSSEIVNLCLDKYQCMQYLASKHIDVPATNRIDIVPDTFPVIIKPNKGQGSKNVKIIENVADFERTWQAGNQIWQTYIPDYEGEYTCGVFRSKSMGTRHIIFKRELDNGRTISGQVVRNEQIENVLTQIAKILSLDGAINVQLRLLHGVPYVFEINPRLSSTLVFRHELGFRDLKWWIDELLGHSIEDYHRPKAGMSFFRGELEVIMKV